MYNNKIFLQTDVHNIEGLRRHALHALEELVEEDLGDDLVFVAVIAEAVVGTDGLEVVDEGGGLDLEGAGHGQKFASFQCALFREEKTEMPRRRSAGWEVRRLMIDDC